MMLNCTTCGHLILHRPGYRAVLGVYQEVGARQVIRVGDTDRALCPACAERIQRGYEARIARRRAIGQRMIA